MHTHTGQAAQGAGWMSSRPHLGLPLARGAVEAKAVWPKKLLRRLRPPAAPLLPGISSGNQLQKCWAWLPQAKSQVFTWLFRRGDRYSHQDGPTSTSSGVYLHKCTHTPGTLCAIHLSLDNSAQPLRTEQQWQLLLAEAPPPPQVHTQLGPILIRV